MTDWQTTWLCGGLIALTVIALTSLWHDIKARRAPASTAWAEMPDITEAILRGGIPRGRLLQVRESLGVGAFNPRGLRRLSVMMDEPQQFEKINSLLGDIRTEIAKPSPPPPPPSPTQWERILNG